MADPRTAIALTLVNEGGFQKDPKDHANWSSGECGIGTLVGTKYGITALDLPGMDIENITEEDAINYYSNHYWKPLYSQINPQIIANKLFDLGVLFGIGTAVKALQQALGVTADGVFGPNTLSAVNLAHPILLLASFKSEMRTRALYIAADNPKNDEFLAGWIRRINS